jgi:integrase
VAEGLVMHDLRHTHKTWLAEDGVEPVARDERLGHATPGMDGVYIHVTPAMRRKVLDVLQARWDEYRTSTG